MIIASIHGKHEELQWKYGSNIRLPTIIKIPNTKQIHSRSNNPLLIKYAYKTNNITTSCLQYVYTECSKQKSSVERLTENKYTT